MPTPKRTDTVTKALSFRVSESERANIRASAANCAMTVGEYCRRQTLNKTIKHRFDVDAIAELRRQGGLLKHLHNLGVGHEEETAKAVKAISALIDTFKGPV